MGLDTPSLSTFPPLQQLMTNAAATATFALAQPAALQLAPAEPTQTGEAVAVPEADPSVTATAVTQTNDTAGTAATTSQTPATDLQAADDLALATQVVQTRQDALAASRAGDATALLTSAGATTTLLAVGWAWLPPGADRLGDSWSFQPSGSDIPAVMGPTRTEPIRHEEHPARPDHGPEASYGSHGQNLPPPGQPFRSTLDLMD